jgi:integrase
MNDAQINAKLKAAKPGKYSIGDGLYFRVTAEGSGFFVVRYTINNRRREISLGKYGKLADGLSLSNAKIEAAKIRAQVRDDIDPIAEKNRSALNKHKTVDDVADDWLKTCKDRLENPQIPKRVYTKDIKPSIGDIAVKRINSGDIVDLVRAIKSSGRPTISNDALSYCKQIFNHAMKLGLIPYNPAMSLTMKDAGGIEKSRDRILSLEELKIVFRVMRENHDQFTRDNYIAFILLLCLGVRKGELIAAKWEEFDFEEQVWNLSADRTKTNAGIRIPIPESLNPLFEELKVRSCGSEYLFPSRRASKRRGYISDDTLNHALAKLFGDKGYKKKEKLPNILGKAGIEHFVIHDLRRTFRSLLAQQGVPPHIAERCLNHKLKGVEGVYDRYDYFEERKRSITNFTEAILDIL